MSGKLIDESAADQHMEQALGAHNDDNFEGSQGGEPEEKQKDKQK